MIISDFYAMKEKKERIVMLTCYDYWSAQILNGTAIDCLLVGDTSAMIMHGHKTTIPATVDIIALHVAAVARGAPDKFIIGDLPFLSYRVSREDTVRNVKQLMQAGAHAVKLEGVTGQTEFIHHIVESGVPVMGHLGLTPQSYYQLGGFRVQARDERGLELLLRGAKELEAAGCFAVVLECVPAEVAAIVTREISIPTIGIGAGSQVDGQVLVLQDMLGVTGFKPKFLKTYLNGTELIASAVTRYAEEVRSGQFPSQQESYI